MDGWVGDCVKIPSPCLSFPSLVSSSLSMLD